MENETQEKNEYQFKGNFIKAEIFELVETHKISIKEAWCLLIIDNLIHVYKQDTFISNKTLAMKLQINESMTKKILSKLKGMGILVQTRFDGRKRYMNVDWNVAKNILLKEKQEGCPVKNYDADSELITRQTCKKLHGRRVKNYTHNSNTKINKSKYHSRETRESDENQSKSIWEKYASNFLKATIIERKTNPPSIKQWGRQLKQFCHNEEIEQHRAKIVLRWYCKQFDKEKHPYSRKYLPKYVPQANSMSGFVEKFYDIERAMLREKEGVVEFQSKKITLDDLSPEDLYIYKAFNMNFNPESFSSPTCKIENTLELVMKLIEFAYKVKEKLTKGKDFKENWDRCDVRVCTLSYACYCAIEARKWPEWRGNMMVFAPGGKHFLNYFKDIFTRSGLTEQAEVVRVVYETAKG